MRRRDDYLATARAIAVYLAERQRPDGQFPGPDHYGVASALWLWSELGADFARQVDRAWNRLKQHPPESHKEFNAYALLHCRRRLGEAPIDALLRRLHLDGRHSANWMLLRAVCRADEGPFRSLVKSEVEARAALLRYAHNGLISDRSGVRSFSYHAFCGALLADLWRLESWEWAGRGAVNAARFIAPFVLPNGAALYVGRGQEQLFGYGALLYLLEAAFGMTGDERYGGLADRVFVRLTRFQRKDGSFPLVLREGEESEPWAPNSARPGWYTYNRYADYLPFFGAMLLKAAHVDAVPVEEVKESAASDDFRVITKERYTAVLARPGGAPTNDLAFPYICVDRESLFPCYGLEGDTAPPGAAPLPYGLLENGEPFGFRDRLDYELMDDGLTGRSREVVHERRFAFEEHGFECVDEILFKRRQKFAQFASANFLFRALTRVDGGRFETWHRSARAQLEMEPEGGIIPAAAVSASGPLVGLRHSAKGFEPKAGERIVTRLRVRFR
ncbi:MAG: hypothetical protein JXA57_18260 [Armatimonadetes bacterium]|nr:hypothetical protein [Armatimonadota bacterium]